MDPPEFSLGRRRDAWISSAKEPEHPLHALDGLAFDGGALQVLLGPTSRFGARYFAALLAMRDRLSREPVVSGLHHSGALPSYNWIEVAETNERLTLRDGQSLDIGPQGIVRVFELLLGLLPPGGHLMVEYDSPQRAETARALALGVPHIATPLGESLFRLGFGAHFKDWQIAEGGSEGPRKLQAYNPPTDADAQRWRQEAAEQLTVFLQGSPSQLDIIQAARERANALLPLLRTPR